MSDVKSFPAYREKLVKLSAKLGSEIPQTLSGFQTLHKQSLKDNHLTTSTKELIALGIAVVVRCDGCIAYHVHDALKAGATREEIVETIGVAILMGGGPAMIYGLEALEALEQYLENGTS